MSEIKLMKPTMEYAGDILKLREEILASKDEDSFAGCYNLGKYLSIEEWIKDVSILESTETCPKDKVPSNVYIAVRLSDNKIVGIIDFRHHINHPVLSVWGGHIGYSVRPDERRKGYGKEMLRQTLQSCKNHGLSKVMITCDSINIASEKTIIANGGVFEKEISVDDIMMKRYWIYL